MKILVIGGGGREHALCWSLHRARWSKRSSALPATRASPKSPTAFRSAACDIVEIADLAEKLHVDLTVVGPELPLSLGIADEFIKRELPIFGPSRLAAQIESSKVFSKEFFWRHKIPTPEATSASPPTRPGKPSRSTASRSSSRPTGWPAGRAS